MTVPQGVVGDRLPWGGEGQGGGGGTVLGARGANIPPHKVGERSAEIEKAVCIVSILPDNMLNILLHMSYIPLRERSV